MSKMFMNPQDAIQWTKSRLLDFGFETEMQSWQSREGDYKVWELLNHSFSFPIPSTIEEMQKTIKPNLPWAEDHFHERVGGEPLNPGKEYQNWPYYKRNSEDDTFRVLNGKFSHTYMERIWPDKHLSGIRYFFGDLNDVFYLLAKDPTTRQAYLPIWFPEDTGVVHGERVPCTLGYHFIIRHGLLYMTYYIRSCDILRHFRDDIYLACRLAYWILKKVTRFRKANFGKEEGFQLGVFTMHIVNLHCFSHEKGLIKSV